MITRQRIGVFAGTFDPVHAGHIGFALQALNEADLDEVYFMPERMPRTKSGTEHYGHRTAMLKRALEPYNSLAVVELVDKHFSVNRTVPQLEKMFYGADLVLVMGADTFGGLPKWANISRLVDTVGFVVSVRNEHDLRLVNITVAKLRLPSSKLHIMDSSRPTVSSSSIRDALRQNMSTTGLLPSVSQYAKREWLYVKVPHAHTI